MPEVIRSIASRLRKFVGDRRRSPRCAVKLPVAVSLLDAKHQANGARRAQLIEGYTRDISISGAAIILPAIRTGERYLVGEGNLLHITLEHPTGPLTMQVEPVRYEKLAAEGDEKGYLIGVRIIGMEDDERERYTVYISGLIAEGKAKA